MELTDPPKKAFCLFSGFYYRIPVLNRKLFHFTLFTLNHALVHLFFLDSHLRHYSLNLFSVCQIRTP